MGGIMSRDRNRQLASCILMLVAVLCFSGCAVQSRGNKIVFSTDYAQLMGEVVDEAKMADGSTVTLRRLGDDYSLKFGVISRMVPLGKLAGGRILNVTPLSNATNILLETDTGKNASCPRYVMVSLSGTVRADKWDIPGNCRQRPVRILTGQDVEAVDFVDGRDIFRYTFQGGNLFRSKATLPPEKTASTRTPSSSSSSAASQTNKPTPKPSSTRTTSTASAASAPAASPPPVAAKTDRSSPKDSGTQTSAAASAPAQRKDDDITLPKNLDFGKPQEMKKISIDLT
jgi:hypothetical protein